MSTQKQDQEFEKVMKDEIEVSISVNGSALDRAVDFIADYFDPEDVFTSKQLASWAESNGYVKE